MPRIEQRNEMEHPANICVWNRSNSSSKPYESAPNRPSRKGQNCSLVPFPKIFDHQKSPGRKSGSISGITEVRIISEMQHARRNGAKYMAKIMFNGVAVESTMTATSVLMTSPRADDPSAKLSEIDVWDRLRTIDFGFNTIVFLLLPVSNHVGRRLRGILTLHTQCPTFVWFND